MTKTFWIGILCAFSISLTAVVYQKYFSGPFCAYDGSAVNAVFEVDIDLRDGSKKIFCSIFCAQKWFNNNLKEIDHVIVTDEIRGSRIDSFVAYFVQSELITNRSNDNRIHVFKLRQDAKAHVKKFDGIMIDDPFAGDM